MNMNSTPSGERIHIGIFGKRNAGKSSIINAITGQDLAIVSDIKGTTTDPVLKTMELLPLGPVVLIDTPGLDDDGDLGQERIRKAYQILNKTDIALLVVDASMGITEEDEAILERIQDKEIPYVIAMNKSDLAGEKRPSAASLFVNSVTAFFNNRENIIWVSTTSGEHIQELKELIAAQAPKDRKGHHLVADLLSSEDIVVLVVPVDSAAPKGRLILPQQQVIRDVLDANAMAFVTQTDQLSITLSSLQKSPRLVVTDSQAFEQVSRETPTTVPLTSFSILMARFRGNLEPALKGAHAIDTLQNDDRVLICEGCTHHRQCDDIGTVKLPKWLRDFTGKTLNLSWTSGTEFPADLSPYKLVIHCGGCMLNEKEMQYRYRCCEDQQIPITNYGTAIAHMKGILARSIAPLTSHENSIRSSWDQN